MLHFRHVWNASTNFFLHFLLILNFVPKLDKISWYLRILLQIIQSKTCSTIVQMRKKLNFLIMKWLRIDYERSPIGLHMESFNLRIIYVKNLRKIHVNLCKIYVNLRKIYVTVWSPKNLRKIYVNLCKIYVNLRIIYV